MVIVIVRPLCCGAVVDREGDELATTKQGLFGDDDDRPMKVLLFLFVNWITPILLLNLLCLTMFKVEVAYH